MENLSPARIQPLSPQDQNADSGPKRKASAKALSQNSRKDSPVVADPESDEKHQLDERA
jgi:hypothetical protein